MTDELTVRIDGIREAKYFRYSVDRWDRTSLDDIVDERNKFNAFKENGICEEVIYLVTDRFFHYKDSDASKEIKEKLKKMKEDGIITL